MDANPHPAASHDFSEWQRHHKKLARLCKEISQLLHKKERHEQRCQETYAEHVRLLQEHRRVPNNNHEAVLHIERAQQQNLASLQRHWDSVDEIIPQLVRNLHDLEQHQEDYPGSASRETNSLATVLRWHEMASGLWAQTLAELRNPHGDAPQGITALFDQLGVNDSRETPAMNNNNRERPPEGSEMSAKQAAPPDHGDRMCYICYENIPPGTTPCPVGENTVAVLTSCCNHVFHRSCLDSWWDSQPGFACPFCRRPGE